MVDSTWAKGHVPALTAVLSVVSLALVFAAALGLLPAGALPQPRAVLNAIPHLNAVISLTAIGTILAGVRAIKAGRVDRHRVLMLASFGLFAAFLFLYLYRVAVLGPTTFDGPGSIRTFVYLPILVVHIGLAILCVPFVFYALLSAGTRPVEEIYGSNHPRAGRVAAVLWLVSFSMGIVIYLLLYHVY
jgi:putative membrane protein